MWQRVALGAGVALVGVAVLAVPSVAVVGAYAGGSAVHNGYVEDGRYFVAPCHGKPVAEVSGPLWRTVYWVEMLWPWSAVVTGLLGLFLTGADRWSDGPPPVPPPEPPPWLLGACAAVVVVTLAGARVAWVVTGAAWVVWLVGWALVCAGAALVGWLYKDLWRRAAAAGPGAAPAGSAQPDHPG